MPFVYREASGVGFYEVSGWPGASGVFSTRYGGVSRPPFAALDLGHGGGDSAEAVTENRRLFSGALGISPAMLKTINQVHGTEIYVLKDLQTPVPFEGYDAIITNLVGPAVVVQTADCVPILLYDPVARAVGAVHAGWASTVGGIAGKAVAAMTAEYGTDPKDVMAAVGPSIGPCCYEVDEKVVEPLRKLMDTDAGILNPTRAGHWLMDLWETNVRVLLSAGLHRKNITIMGLCTSCNTDRFYSHRKSMGRTGRMMAVVRLTDNDVRRENG